MTVLSDDELINLYIANCGNESGYKDVAKSLRAVADAAVAAYVVDHIPDAKKMVEPFGYFRADALGWTDCSPDDEGAVALYERPAPQPVALSTQDSSAELFEALVMLLDQDDNGDDEIWVRAKARAAIAAHEAKRSKS